MRYRLYIDESGDHTYSTSLNPDVRYLGLTGVLLEDDYYRSYAQPALEALKQRHFPFNPDDPVILVRRRLIDRKGTFGRLNDPDNLDAWNRDFFTYMRDLEATIFTCVIDKQMHHARHGEAAYHPYHYCMEVMLERLLRHLRVQEGVADVVAGSRGGSEDQLLMKVYQEIWANGTANHSGADFQAVLSSKDLKLRKKQANIADLQVADLIAAPSKLEIIEEHNMPLTYPASLFTPEFNRIIRPKYYRDGRVLLGK